MMREVAQACRPAIAALQRCATTVTLVLALAYVGSGFSRTYIAAQQQPARVSGGNGTFYIGGYPNLIWILDEATEKVTGTIQLKTGIPRRCPLWPETVTALRTAIAERTEPRQEEAVGLVFVRLESFPRWSYPLHLKRASAKSGSPGLLLFAELCV